MQMTELLAVTGLSEKAVRLYEAKGLIAPARAANGRRQFGPHDVETLTFLAQARRLGFPLADCVRLLALSQDANRRSVEVKAIAQQFLEDLESKKREIDALTNALGVLIQQCPGNDSPDCAIIDALASSKRPNREAR